MAQLLASIAVLIISASSTAADPSVEARPPVLSAPQAATDDDAQKAELSEWLKRRIERWRESPDRVIHSWSWRQWEQALRARESAREAAEKRPAEQRQQNTTPTTGGSRTRTFGVGDLLATTPEQRRPMFDSPEALITALKVLTGADNWEHEGGMTIDRRRRVLTVLHRREIIGRVNGQLARFRMLGHGEAMITVRLLFVPDHANLPTSSNRATLLSDEERRRIYEEYEGDLGEVSERDYKGRHTTRDRDNVYVWTNLNDETDASYRGVSVVVEIEPRGDAVTIAPIPFAGDEQQVDWSTLRVEVGQCVAYELPATVGPDGKRDDDRVIAFVCVNAITPGE